MSAASRNLGTVAFWLVTAVGALITGWFVFAAAGVLPVRSAERPVAAAVRAPLASVPAPEPRAPAATTQPQPPAAAQRVTVTVTAARGDSWISARLGSESGRVLDERLLAQGETARVTGPRVWLLVGASANVDVRVNGKPRSLAPGTVETVFAPTPLR
jgi:hypothetical protein